MDQSRRQALLAAQAALEKKAADVEIIDVSGKVDYADYLVLMTGRSDRHVAAIAEAVDELLGEHGMRAISVEGLPAAHWVLIDLVDVVVHVFLEETRALYDLDGDGVFEYLLSNRYEGDQKDPVPVFHATFLVSKQPDSINVYVNGNSCQG